MKNNNIVGIDLGTTMSVIANINKDGLGVPEVIANKETGHKLTPSVVVFDGDEIEIGDIARSNEVARDRGLLADLFKRKMSDKDYRFNAEGVEYSATQLSSMILEHLVEFASKEVGEIQDVVISVPARFGNDARSATIEAGRQAGLNVLGIIDEPTAAGLFFSENKNINGTVLVYDLGGGTFDISIMDIQSDGINILLSGGDELLGGVDFDQKMLEIMSDKYKEACGGELCATEEEKHTNLLLAEDIKKSLSIKDIIHKKLIGSEGRVKVSISKSEFEEKTADLVLRAELKIEELLNEKEGVETIKPEDIDTILLVGGSTRMPMISKSIQEIFNKEPNVSVNVDTAIAEGAAIKAKIILASMGENVPGEIKTVTGSATRGYGTFSLDAGGEKNTIIIEKNMPIPCENTETFYTVSDGQEGVDVEITEGESESREDVIVIDKFTMQLPGGRPAGQPVEITYSYDDNQIMHCLIKDINTGKEKHYTTNKVG
jgi:molecular chaperone DnaK